MYQRTLDIANLLKIRSFFLLGPRAVGKSTLIHQQLPHAKIYNLLDLQMFRRLLQTPQLIAEQTTAEDLVVIDEIQKMPELLDEVHRLIEDRKQKFLLTGSSARKLKAGHANLLAGRAFFSELFPLTSQEIPNFDLLTYLNTTGLPEFYGNAHHHDFLSTYVGTYLKEEIRAEALTKNLAAFTIFLDVIALSNGEEINIANLASDAGVTVRTCSGYISILEDTLLGFTVPPFLSTKKRKAVTRPKFYLFDVGVTNLLCNRGEILPKSELFGKAFEHFIALELRAFNSYTRLNLPMTYWRSESQFEVDFVLGTDLAIEVKATDVVSDKHLKGIRALKEEGLIKNFVVVSTDPERHTTQDGIAIVPYAEFLSLLWLAKSRDDLANLAIRDS